MRRTILSAVVAAGTALTLTGAPALADTLVVGYTTVEFEPAVDGDHTEAQGIRVQGLVVDDLEPRSRDGGEGEGCPAAGCDYALLAVDPAAIQASTAGQGASGAGCDTHEYGVVEASPQQRDVSGARVYTATGALPERTVGAEGGTEPLTPGVGLLCFAASAHDRALTENPDAPPTAATQPVPAVVVHDREPGVSGSADWLTEGAHRPTPGPRAADDPEAGYWCWATKNELDSAPDKWHCY